MLRLGQERLEHPRVVVLARVVLIVGLVHRLEVLFLSCPLRDLQRRPSAHLQFIVNFYFIELVLDLILYELML